MKGDIETAAWIIAFAIMLHGCQAASPSIATAYVKGLTGHEVQQ